MRALGILATYSSEPECFRWKKGEFAGDISNCRRFKPYLSTRLSQAGKHAENQVCHGCVTGTINILEKKEWRSLG